MKHISGCVWTKIWLGKDCASKHTYCKYKIAISSSFCHVTPFNVFNVQYKRIYSTGYEKDEKRCKVHQVEYEIYKKSIPSDVWDWHNCIIATDKTAPIVYFWRFCHIWIPEQWIYSCVNTTEKNALLKLITVSSGQLSFQLVLI